LCLVCFDGISIHGAQKTLYVLLSFQAYIPQRDIYIEKDASINEEIDRLRFAATSYLVTRRDTIVVASVSCIYGLGSAD